MTRRDDGRRWPINPRPVIPDQRWHTQRRRFPIEAPTNPGHVSRPAEPENATLPTGRSLMPAPRSTPGAAAVENGRDAGGQGLILDGVTRRFGALLAVNSVDLTVPAGQRHALIGPNGAGKSTLLNLIAGTVRPTTGRIRYADCAITGHSAARRAQAGIGRTFQQPTCHPSLTVLDNLLLAGWRHTAGRSPWRTRSRRDLTHRGMQLLDRFDLADLATHTAGGLSHGQRRLLDIAAALAGQPRLLLLDEPAAGLVDTDLHLLITILRTQPRSVTVLLVEHNLDVVTAIAEQVTVLHHGRALTTGTPDQIRAHPRVQQIYLGTAQTGEKTAAGGGTC